MSETASRLEEEIEARRAGVAQTLDTIRQQVSPQHLVQEMGHFLGVDDMGGAVRAAGRHMRSHPVAYGLIGAGLAWMLLSGRSEGGHSDGAGRRDWQDDWGAPSGRDRSGMVGRIAQGAKEAGASFASGLGHAASGAGSSVSDAVQGVGDAVSSLSGSVAETGRHWADRVAEKPLLAGAGAMLAGAVIGAALPHSRVEDRVLAPSRRVLADEARAAGEDLAHRAGRVARESYAAAVQTAREEGLVPEGETSIADRVERVAHAALDEAKAQIEGGGEGSPQGGAQGGRGKSGPRTGSGSGSPASSDRSEPEG